ncbi:MAG: DUF402 domain-containing protein [Bacilli bacterium]
MNKLCIGDKLQIQCYKHNGNVHRSWDEATLLDEQKDYLVFANNKTIVTKAEGITWKTKEPAIMYFFKDKWFNIIAQLKKDGIYYYCNIASPFIIEENTIKYIDYDLDLRVFPTGQYKILDRLEYNYHKKIMNYSTELDIVIRSALTELINEYQKGIPMFQQETNLNYHIAYKELQKK